MKIKWLKSNLLIVIILIWLIIGIGLLCSNWLWDWQVIEAIATWILAVSIVIIIYQQRESGKQSRVEFTERRLEVLNTPDMKEALKIACEKAPSKLIDLTKKDRVKVILLFERMHTLGLLVEKGYADKKLTIEAHRGKFIRCWYKLKQCICYERCDEGKYGEGIEYLAKEAYKYQQENIPDKNEWAKIDGKVCEIDTDETCK